jgi:hypothetical protein
MPPDQDKFQMATEAFQSADAYIVPHNLLYFIDALSTTN